MKYLMLIFLLAGACKSGRSMDEKQGSSADRKAAAARIFYDMYILHFSISTPLAHPVKIEERVIQMRDNDRRDTIERSYYYENDLLVKVLDNEYGSATYVLQYDEQQRLTLVEQVTSEGSFHKYTFHYGADEKERSVRKHFMYNKLEDTHYFTTYGQLDSILISSIDGPEMCRFSEVEDTVFVERVWRDNNNYVMSTRIEAYDSSGRELKIDFIENGELDRTINYAYDQRGNQLLREDKDIDHAVGKGSGILGVSAPSVYHTAYEYDSEGNWTMKMEKNESNTWSALTTRKIIYKP